MSWRDRFPDEVTCVRCLQVKEARDLDRLLWCEACREIARERAARWSWIVGAVLAGGLALWIWLVIEPSDLVIGGWIATVLAALWLGAKVAREIFYGAMRFRNRRAVEASPPTRPLDEPEAEDPSA